MSRRRVPIRQEVIGFRDAFPDDDGIAPRPKLPPQAKVRLVGGPLDGGFFFVPRELLQARAGTKDPEFPVKLPPLSERLIVPGERVRHGIYRLDRSAKLLRYVTTVTLPGG